MKPEEELAKEKELTHELIQTIETNSEYIKEANEQLVNVFSSIEFRNGISVIKDSIEQLQKEIDIDGLFNTAKNIVNSYDIFLKNYRFDLDSLKSTLVNTAYLLNISQNTSMITNATKLFTDANINGLVKLFNDSINKEIINASDISFFKVSNLVEKLDNEIQYPKGIKTSISIFNKETAFSLINDNTINYSTTEKCFISNNGYANSNTMNMISRGKNLLHNISKEELFSENELMNFNSELFRNPSFSTLTETGTKIIALIGELFDSNEKTINFDRDVFYHNRSRNKDATPYVYDQMLKAPIGLPDMGRFNYTGRSYYYFANTREGAETEIMKHLKEEKEIQTIRIIPIKTAKLLDLSNTIKRASSFLKYLRFPLKDSSEKIPTEYLLPCFVGECCRNVGFEGIKYQGSEKYDNYVVWNEGYFNNAGFCE